MRSLVVLTAGLSEPSSTRRLAETIAEATEAKISARGEGVNTHIIEVRTLASELATAMTNWAAPTPQLDEAKELLSTADGFIAVTPAFQGSYSGLFKMFFDVLDAHALEELPTIVAATGGSPRHALILDYALRPLLNYLHAHVVPTGIFQATEDLGTAEGARIRSRIERAATQLADQMIRPTDRVAGLADAPKPSPHSRPTGIGVDEEFLPFEEILSQYDGKR